MIVMSPPLRHSCLFDEPSFPSGIPDTRSYSPPRPSFADGDNGIRNLSTPRPPVADGGNGIHNLSTPGPHLQMETTGSSTAKPPIILATFFSKIIGDLLTIGVYEFTVSDFIDLVHGKID